MLEFPNVEVAGSSPVPCSSFSISELLLPRAQPPPGHSRRDVLVEVASNPDAAVTWPAARGLEWDARPQKERGVWWWRSCKRIAGGSPARASALLKARGTFLSFTTTIRPGRHHDH